MVSYAQHARASATSTSFWCLQFDQKAFQKKLDGLGFGDVSLGTDEEGKNFVSRAVMRGPRRKESLVIAPICTD
eukprot:SAG31_NODE_1711_length_7472_cov_2.107555_4_plen_74_part_00